MLKQSTQSIETAVKGTVLARGSLGKVGSMSYFADNIGKTLHTGIKSYEDAIAYCEKYKKKKVYGVYLRFVREQKIKVKIGKGVVYYLESEKKARLTRDHNSADNQPLETKDGGAFIPCVSEEAALALEGAVHKYFGKLERVTSSIDNKFSVVDSRWLKPGVNSEGGSGGYENFNFEDIWENKVEVFVNAIKFLTKQSQVNQQDFTKKARDPQVEGSDLLCEWLLNGGDLEDFFLLMKPRAGKNTTMFWGIAKYVKILKETNPDKTPTIDFVSLWPSAFGGAQDDLEKYFYINGITLKGVNTSDDNWQETYEELLKDPKVDAVFRFASLQSIDLQSAKDYNEDEDREGAEIDYVPSKAEYFKSNPGDICIIDESDHGMRTDRSTDVLTEFGYTKRVWMSGTDLYALKNKIVFNPIQNHFLYDILSEIQDVIAGKHHMPRMKKHSLVAKLLPGEEIDKEMMSQKELTRKIVALFDTNNKGKWKYNAVSKLFVDEQGKEYQFKNLTEVAELFEKTYHWDVDIGGAISDTPNPADFRHIFCSMPSVKSCMALYNHIKRGDIKCRHNVLLANLFGSADRIERQVNDAMIGKRTIFLTVGKMLRGAKAPWNCVIRFDRWNDYKIGLQLELRGQNTNDDWFHVYDANCFRAESMNYELHKSRSKSFGKKVDSEGKKLHHLIPMTRKGEFEEETVTWDDCVSSWQAGRITESFKRDTLFDEQGLLNAQDLLEGSTKTSDNVKGSKDDREGKEGSTKKTPTGPKGPKQIDQLKILKQQAKTLSTMLPILLIISDCKYREIDTLIKNTSDNDLEDLLKGKCNIKNINKDFKKKIVKMFDAEEINHQLYIACKKLVSSNFDVDYSEFSVQKNGDVITPRECINETYQNLLKSEYDNVIDISCGTGEWVIELVKQKKIKSVTIADTNEINLKIAKKRIEGLKIDIKEIIHYNKDTLESKMEGKEFDLVVGNPPYQNPGKTKGQKIWYRIAQVSHRICKEGGEVILLTPNSWMSGGQNTPKGPNGWGLFRDLFTNTQVLTTKVTNITDTYFKNAGIKVGIDISWFHLHNLPTYQETKVIVQDGEFFSDFRSINFLSSEPTIISNSIVKKTLGNKDLEKFKIVYHDNQERQGVLIEKKVPEGDYKIPHYILGSSNTENLEISYLDHKHKKDVSFKKVIFTLQSRFWQPHLDLEGMSSLCQGYSVIINDDTTLEGFTSVWYSKLFTYLMKNLQINRNGMMKRSYVDNIPYIDMSKVWTDDEIYNLFNLTDEEKEYINART